MPGPWPMFVSLSASLACCDTVRGLFLCSGYVEPPATSL